MVIFRACSAYSNSLLFHFCQLASYAYKRMQNYKNVTKCYVVFTKIMQCVTRVVSFLFYFCNADFAASMDKVLLGRAFENLYWDAFHILNYVNGASSFSLFLSSFSFPLFSSFLLSSSLSLSPSFSLLLSLYVKKGKSIYPLLLFSVYKSRILINILHFQSH